MKKINYEYHIVGKMTGKTLNIWSVEKLSDLEILESAKDHKITDYKITVTETERNGTQNRMYDIRRA